MKQQTILITGGAGFLGSHLCKHYVDAGWQVVCVDNLSSGRRQNIKNLESKANFSFVQHDICLPLPAKIEELKLDIVANLASPASPPLYQRLAKETLMVGSTGTINMLELASKQKARFIQASTSEVYGDPDVNPQIESYRGSVNPYGPRSMYDESKRFGEAATYVYRQKNNLNTGVARFFNTYGPNMDPEDGRVVSNFIVQALAGKPLTVYGEGNQTRSFCYVDDLIKGLVALIESDVEGPINLGNAAEFTVLELAKLVKELTGSKSELVYEPLPGDDPIQRCPDLSLAKAELGWQPTTPLRQGLEKTIAYFSKS